MTRRQITYMTEIKDILSIVVLIKAKLDFKFSKLTPFWQRPKEEWLIVVQAKIAFSSRNVGNFFNVTICSKICSISEIHWSWTSVKVIAGGIDAGRSNTGLEFIDIVMGAVGKVGKANGMIVVGTVRLARTGWRRQSL